MIGDDDYEDDGVVRDHPLSLCWHAPDGIAAGLGLPPAKSPQLERAREQVLAEAAVVASADPWCWISYSRRKEFYVNKRRYYSASFTYTYVPQAIDLLALDGFIDHQKAEPKKPSPGALGRQSSFRASDMLLAALGDRPLPVKYARREVIILRDHPEKNDIDYPETDETYGMRTKLMAINEAIAASEIRLDGTVMKDGQGFTAKDGHRRVARRALHRVFNRGSFLFGGRIYGGFWQQMSEEERSRILINGSPTVEVDYSQLHPKLLYAVAGKPLFGDAYDLPDWDRDELVKPAFNTLVNADNDHKALGAVAKTIRKFSGADDSADQAQRLIAELTLKHAPVAAYFGSGVGLRLMRHDSDMAEQVMMSLLKQGVVPLPIHDSFIVEAAAETKLAEAMGKAINQKLRALRTSAGFWGYSGKSVPHNGKITSDSGGLSAAIGGCPSLPISRHAA